MEISLNSNPKNDIQKINKSQNEDSILKPGVGLIKNEIKPTEDNSIEEYSDEAKNKIIPSKKCKLYLFAGRTLFLFLDKYSNPLFIIGPHWPLYVCLNSLVSLIMLFIYLKFWSVYGFYTKLCGNILFWTFFISYTYTSLINPGFPKNTIGRTFGIPKNDYYFCSYCRFYLKKCSYGSHCEFCQICIEKHDHHCVWTGHCIGKNNKITFYIFVTSIFCLIPYFGYAFYEGLNKTLNI